MFYFVCSKAGKRGAPEALGRGIGAPAGGEGKKSKRSEDGEEGEEGAEASVKLFELPQIMPPPPCLFLQVFV